MKMTTPLEIGIVVHDMQPMIDFYVNVIGLKVVGDHKAVAAKSSDVGTTPHGYRVVRMQTPYGERIKLAQPDKDAPAPAPASKWVYHRPGICYITFVIADMPEMVKKLKEHGVKMISQEPVEVRSGITCLNVQDPEGNFVEFVEHADVQSYRPDVFKWKQFF